MINRHLIGSVPVHIRGQLHFKAERGIPANILHYINIQAKEFVYGPVFLHNFQNTIDKGHFIVMTFQVPHHIVKCLNCAVPRCVLNKVTNHLKVLEVMAPILPRKFCRIFVYEVTLFSHEGHANIVPETCHIAKWEVKEDNILSGVEVLARLEFDCDGPLVM